ncbi:MAG: 50S ribosomal protein L11 [Nanoarchaeota archaeon]|nr:50S ribosomal protein L11 [Nanoarchaeota archaeon]MBU4352556.1 50S ribosomal protein L11 [Nanoarchaeota archaeon]
MAKKEKVEALIDGGKATAAPPLGQALGPLGVNIGQIITDINKKTEAYKGMKVPVTIMVDPKTKEYEITIGTPPTSALIKKELSINKGAGIPNKDKVGNLAIEQIVKIVKMKEDSLLAKDLKSAVKTIIGSCNSLGVLVEGKTAPEINKDIEAGKYDEIINNQKTDVSDEKKAVLKEQLEKVREFYSKDLAKIKAAAEEESKEEAEKKESAEAKPAEAAKKEPEKKK